MQVSCANMLDSCILSYAEKVQDLLYWVVLSNSALLMYAKRGALDTISLTLNNLENQNDSY